MVWYCYSSLLNAVFVFVALFYKVCSTEHKKMLAHCKQLLELNGGCLAIDAARHGKLITSLRTAVEKGDGSLDKDATLFDDCFDSFRLSILFWH